MAAPKCVTLESLSGKWTLDKSLSSPTDPLLALQGMNWVVRKAIGMSSVILDIKETKQDSGTAAKPLSCIEISQTSSSGLRGTTEKRVLDWEERNQEDHIFGKCAVRARWITNSKEVRGRILPSFDVQTTYTADESVGRFLAGEINDDMGTSDGFCVERPDNSVDEGDGLWVQLFIRELNGRWTSEQIWGFEIIGNERRYVRRVVVANQNGQYSLARLVYSYEGEN